MIELHVCNSLVGGKVGHFSATALGRDLRSSGRRVGRGRGEGSGRRAAGDHAGPDAVLARADRDLHVPWTAPDGKSALPIRDRRRTRCVAERGRASAHRSRFALVACVDVAGACRRSGVPDPAKRATRETLKRPKTSLLHFFGLAPVAQLDRAAGFYPAGWGFESSRAHIRSVVAVAQLVRAPGCGPGGRGFNSPRSPSSLLSSGVAFHGPLAQLARAEAS